MFDLPPRYYDQPQLPTQGPSQRPLPRSPQGLSQGPYEPIKDPYYPDLLCPSITGFTQNPPQSYKEISPVVKKLKSYPRTDLVNEINALDKLKPGWFKKPNMANAAAPLQSLHAKLLCDRPSPGSNTRIKRQCNLIKGLREKPVLTYSNIEANPEIMVNVGDSYPANIAALQKLKPGYFFKPSSDKLKAPLTTLYNKMRCETIPDPIQVASRRPDMVTETVTANNYRRPAVPPRYMPAPPYMGQENTKAYTRTNYIQNLPEVTNLYSDATLRRLRSNSDNSDNSPMVRAPIQPPFASLFSKPIRQTPTPPTPFASYAGFIPLSRSRVPPSKFRRLQTIKENTKGETQAATPVPLVSQPPGYARNHQTAIGMHAENGGPPTSGTGTMAGGRWTRKAGGRARSQTRRSQRRSHRRSESNTRLNKRSHKRR